MRMSKCAKALAVAGFILMGWQIYGLGKNLWLVWQLNQEMERSDFPFLGVSLGLWRLFYLGMNSFLLLWLARPDPSGRVVRYGARLWVLPSFATVAWGIWANSMLMLHPHFPAFATTGLYVRLWSSMIVTTAFALGSLSLLWVLSRQPRQGAIHSHTLIT